ncbi:sulfur carrier protein ThiS [Seonamhaeicola marinus]|uniref:Sulfur carrier protein ThiS n=1 Tax=Seonamhaeicola marinus TaxID=1912246 RepID=A0A5D0HFK7_9FLAO|nr:sulfur carrier protein ThiS [Seonamhaeicola marinus]TYA70093.1 sulfur carrier protein ThiS [Seonamhaeicola marinus]
MITITINNQTKEISKAVSVEQLLNDLNQQSQGIAVAVNQSIISRHNWDQEILNDGDDILIIQATQGG